MLKFKLYPLEKFGLKFGVSIKKMHLISQLVGSNPTNFKFKLKRFQNSYVRRQFDLVFYSKFRSLIKRRLKFFWNIRLYRGVRHKLHLPSRGQRTHTNGKTKRKFRL